MLAILTPNPDSTAETFIRQHIRLIRPGETAVLYFEGDGESVREHPTMKISRLTKNSLWSRFVKLMSYVTHGYSGSITGNEKQQVIEFLRTNKVSCVLAEFGQMGCAIKSTCKSANIPLFVFFHGHDAGAAGRKLKNRYSYWRLGRYTSKVFVATKFFANTVSKVGIPKEKIEVAPYGLELAHFYPSQSRDYKLIVAVGRMVEKKAPHLTVHAFAKALQSFPGARLEMIGDGPLLGRAKEVAESLGVDDKVVFHGARDHEFVKQKVSKAAIFVQHSLTAPNGDTESLGVSLLEAMACEVPIVTTRHNGFVETVDDGVTGFLVEEGDVEAMALRIVEILKDGSLRDKMGKAGRERVKQHYEAKKQAQLLRKVLNSCKNS